MTFREKLERWDPDRCGYRSEKDLIDTAIRLHEEEQRVLRERVEELERLNKEHREDLARLYEADAAIADLEADLSRLRELADRMSADLDVMAASANTAVYHDWAGGEGWRQVLRTQRDRLRSWVKEYRAWRDAGKEAKS